MSFAPLPDAIDMSRVFEVATVSGFVQPSTLASGFTRLATLGLGAIALASDTSGVGSKERLTVQTFTVGKWTSHWPESPQTNDLSTDGGVKDPDEEYGRAKKREEERRRGWISQFGEEDGRTSTANLNRHAENTFRIPLRNWLAWSLWLDNLRRTINIGFVLLSI